jgi:hypothetical protein
MYLAIQLYRKTLFRAIKIDNIISDTILSAKLFTVHCLTSKKNPQRSLGGSSVISKFLSNELKISFVIHTFILHYPLQSSPLTRGRFKRGCPPLF